MRGIVRGAARIATAVGLGLGMAELLLRLLGVAGVALIAVLLWAWKTRT